MEFRRVLFRSAAVGELRNVVVNMLPVEAGRDLAGEERVQGFQAHHAGSCGIEGPSHGHSALVAVPVVRRGGAEFFPFRDPSNLRAEPGSLWNVSSAASSL